MAKHYVSVKSMDCITHDVIRIVTEKPPHYHFIPGQATEVAINKAEWVKAQRPFTFTAIPENEYLEFVVKTYASHKGVTNELLQLKANDELILEEPFGAIAYEGEGLFIAGGAGVTPFISILRYLRSTNSLGKNKLIFANKTKADILFAQEFETMLGPHFINILSEEKAEGYAYGFITEDFLKTHIETSKKKVYVCGPPPMMDAINKQLRHLGVNKGSIITESF